MLQLYGFDIDQFSRFAVFRMTMLILFGDFDDFFKLKIGGQDEQLPISYVLFGVFTFSTFLLQVIYY